MPIIPLAGTGVSAGSGFASFAEGLKRAKLYLEAANEEMFLPRDLMCKVMKIGRIMLAVGHSSEVLFLPLLENGGDLRTMRLRVLGDQVA